MKIEQLKAFVLDDIGAQRFKMSWTKNRLALWITPCSVPDFARLVGLEEANAGLQAIDHDYTVRFDLSEICNRHGLDPHEVMPF